MREKKRVADQVSKRDMFRAVLMSSGMPRHCVRVVKEMDSKPIGLCPQGFESPRCRFILADECTTHAVAVCVGI